MVDFSKQQRDAAERGRTAEQEFRNRMYDGMQIAIEASTSWQLETSKHTALMSLAGLAGVFALIAGSRPIPYAIIPALCFALSSLLITLSMRQTHKENEIEIEQAANCFQYLKNKDRWLEVDTQLTTKKTRFKKRAALLFVGALTTLIAGGIVLFVLLSKF